MAKKNRGHGGKKGESMIPAGMKENTNVRRAMHVS
jgi:hypothetical protein